MTRRAKKPLNQCAIDCANQKFYANHPGDPELFDAEGNWIPLHPTSSEHTPYRIEWMDLYEQCGGEVEYDGGGGGGGGKTDPFDPVVPCKDDELILVEVKEQAVIGPRSELRPVVDSREQYVNLDDQIDTSVFHPEYGRVIRLLARVAWKSGKQSDLEGHTVVWTENHLEDDLVVDLKPSEYHGFNSPGSKTSEHESVTTANGWTPVVEFYLSTYGGYRFSLTASLQSGGPQLPAGTYEVWKKFWYQVTEMKRRSGGRYELPAGAASKCEAWLREVFIRLEEDTASPRAIAEYQPDIPGESKDAVAGLYFQEDHLSPFKAHILMCASVIHMQDARYVEATLDQPLWRSPEVYRLYRVEEEEKPWLQFAAFRRKGRDRWRKLSPKRVTAIRQGDESSWLRYKIEVDFSRGVIKPTPEKPIEIRLRVGVYGSIGVGGNSQHSLVALGQIGASSGTAAKENLGRLMAHEVVHCLGLLNLPPAGAHDHDKWLDPLTRHCNVPGCIMSYKSLKGVFTGFHYDGKTGTGCNEYLRRQDFSRSAMSFWR